MDPVWVVFWCVVLLFTGFLPGFIIPGVARERWRRRNTLWQQLKLGDGTWRVTGVDGTYACDVVLGLAALAGILGVSFGFGALVAGYSELGVPTAFSFAFAAGLTWGAWQWRMPAPPVRIWAGNHEWRPPNETWSERLARWGFPSTRQMEIAAFREDLRRRLDHSKRQAENAEQIPLSGILPPW